MESRFPKGVLLFSITLAVISPTSGKAITCIGGDYTAGDSGSIMCFFPDDIDAHENVYIQRNPFSAPAKESGTEVFICNVEDLKASKCKEEDGYVLKKYTRNTIWVDILNMTERVAGRYTCQFVPPDDSPTEMCNITVRGAVTPASAGDRQSTTVVEKRESSTDANAGETGTNSVGVIVGVIVALLGLAGVIILVIFIMRLCRNRRMKTRRPDSVDGTSGATSPLVTQDDDGTRNPTPGTSGATSPVVTQHDDGTRNPTPESAEKRDIETQVSVERTQDSGTNTENDNVCPITGSVKKRSMETQVSVDRGIPKRSFETQVSVDRLIPKRSLETQVSLDRTMPKRSIETQVNMDRAPGQDDLKVDSGFESLNPKAAYAGKDVLSDSLTKLENNGHYLNKTENPVSSATNIVKIAADSLMSRVIKTLERVESKLD